MKKCLVLLVVCAVLGSLSCQKRAAPAGSASPSAQTVTAALVLAVTGEARVRNGSVEAAVEVGDRLPVGASVRTGPDGSCELDLGEARVRLSANTSFRLSSLVPGAAQVGLEAGRVITKVQKLSGRDGFMVRTKGVACGVRGTLFAVEVGSDGAVSVAVLEGSVALYPDALIATGSYLPGAAASPAVDSAPLVEALSEVTVPAASSAAASALFPQKLPTGEAAAAMLKAARLLAVKPQALSPGARSELEAFARTALALPPPGTGAHSPFELTSTPVQDPSAEPSGELAKRFSRVPATAPAPAGSWEGLGRNEASMDLEDRSCGTIAFDHGTVVAELSKKPAGFWQCQVSGNPLFELKSGKAYLLSFVAWSGNGAVIDAQLIENGKDYDGDGEAFTSRSPQFPIALAESPTHYSIPFVASPRATGLEMWNTHFGYAAGSIRLSAVKVDELPLPVPPPQSAPFNGDFSLGLSGWNCNLNPVSRQDFEVSRGVFHFHHIGDVPRIWDVQLQSFREVSLEKGARYALELDMRASESAPVETLLIEGQKDADGDGKAFTLRSPSMVFEASAEWRRYRLVFTALGTDDRSAVVINLGGIRGDCWIDNIALERLP